MLIARADNMADDTDDPDTAITDNIGHVFSVSRAYMGPSADLSRVLYPKLFVYS